MNLNEYINKSKNIANMKNKEGLSRIKAAFLANFTIIGLPETIKALCYEKGIDAECYNAPYNQYAQEILNKASGLYKFSPNIIFILLDADKLLGDLMYFPYRLQSQEREAIIEERLKELKALISVLKENTTAKIVINSILQPIYTSRGIIENKQQFGLIKSIRHFNDRMENFVENDSQIFIFDMNTFCLKIGYDVLKDNKLAYLGDIKISPSGLVKIAQEYIPYIIPLASKTKKCIVLDLDNTLWGGIIGEDGIQNIRLGPDKEGMPYLDFQKRILELSERGIILAINSKNNHEDAIEVIRKHRHMLLKEEHFACIKINWQDKATNLKEIAKELNIGLDSIVFIDDDKTNRELVRNIVPEVTVVDLPDDPANYASCIENLRLFDMFSITKDDLNRGKSYLEERKREELKSEAPDFKSFLKKLEIKINVMNIDDSLIPRIAQLTQKTNQFNMTTRRYQEEDIKKMSEAENMMIKCIDIKDRFGEYGITGAIVIKKDDISTWNIDSFLMSCRILGKNIEHYFMKYLVNEAKKQGITRITGTFIQTEKNKPAESFYNDFGFRLERIEDSRYIYSLNIEQEKEMEILAEVTEWKR